MVEMLITASDVKCRIRVLGAPSIWTPIGQLATTKPLVFGAALYLGLRRGDAVRRTQLAALLWPDADDATRGERSRWLVHQLRDIGLVGQARAPEIEFGMHEVALDIDALALAASAADALTLVRGDVLAGYEPRISDTFSRWLDDSRDALRSTAIRALDTWLAAARRGASWTQVEDLARRVLALDEYHEGASMALAESLAMNGRHDASLQVLARYHTATFSDASAAHQLREQVEELASRDLTSERRSPLFGRTAILAQLLEGVDASRPSSRRIGLAGHSGIGKSRLLDQLSTVAQLRGTRVARIRCGRADSLRPLSLAADVSRALLEVRGALGASPTSIETLRGFLGEHSAVADDTPSEVRRAAVYAALKDLVGALTDDGPVAVVIDDVQWAEPGSWSILAPLFCEPTTAALSWVVALRAETQDTIAHTFHIIFPPEGAASDQHRDIHWLGPLDRGDVEALCIARVAPRDVPLEVLDVLVRRAAGIPFIAEAIVDHWVEEGDISSLPPSVARLVSARLDRLSADGTIVLESVAVLGPDADLAALEAVCLIERSAMLDTTRELETAGILRAEGGRFSAHALWTEAVFARAPRTTLHLLHRYAAQWLEHVAAVAKSTDHRRHWAIATHWLEAGDPERARRALDGAAEVLAASGFAVQAAAMLERCAELAGVSQATLHYWTRAAQLLLVDRSNEGDAAIRRIHAQYDRVARVLDPSTSPHHEVEAMMHLAFSHLHVSQDEVVRRLMPCATDLSASPIHRITATTRILLRYGRSGMDRSMAEAAWRSVAGIVPATPKERFEAELCAAQYFLRVADQPAVGLAHAERAREALSGDRQLDAANFRGVLLLLTDCLELAGDYDGAQAKRRELCERGNLSGNPSINVFALEALIGAALEAGRPAEARPFLTLLQRPPSETRTRLRRAHTIYCAVCALEEGDVPRARADMDVALEEADTAPGVMPRARILAIYAHLALLENDRVTVELMLPRLHDCFEGRMEFMNHPAYVTAMCLERCHGAEAATTFVRHFLDEIRLERWTPRQELLRFARNC